LKRFTFRISNFLFLLIILLLPSQLGKHFWPPFSQVIGVRIDYLSPTLYATDILICLLFIVWMISLLRISNFKYQISNIKSKTSLPIFYTCLVLGIGIALSAQPLLGLYGYMKLAEMAFLSHYTARHVFKTISFHKILLLFSCAVLFESLLAIAQFYHHGSIGGIFYWIGERTFTGQTPGIANASVQGVLLLRPYGTFPHPNVLAGFLVIGMTLISSKIKIHSSKFEKILFGLSLAIGTIALLLSMSRVSIGLWAVILVFYLVKPLFKYASSTLSSRGRTTKQSSFIRTSALSKRLLRSYFARNDNNKQSIHKLKKFQFSGLILVFIISIAIIVFFTPLRFRLMEISLTEEAVVIRTELMAATFRMVIDHPWLGVGLNNFLVTLPSYVRAVSIQYIQPVHSIYLLALAEIGVAGFVVFCWFLLKSFHKAQPFIQLLLGIILITGFFDHYWLTLQQGQLLFAFVLGLCWTSLHAAKRLRR